MPSAFRSNFKRLKMETSTPRQHRGNQEIELDSSPLGLGQLSVLESTTGGIMSDGSMSVGDGGSISNSSSLCNQTDRLEITPPAVESRAQAMASNSIAANEYFDSSEGFRRRVISMPSPGKLHKPVIAASVLNKSRSVGEVNFLNIGDENNLKSRLIGEVNFLSIGDENNINKSRSTGEVNFLSIGDENDDLPRLQAEKKIFLEDWVEVEGSYGLDVMFLNEEELHEQETDEIIKERTKNKLFQIFIKCCGNKIPKRRCMGESVGVLATPGKRKSSPSQPEPSSVDDGTASTARRKVRRVDVLSGDKNDAGTRPRLHTLSCKLSTGEKKRQLHRPRNNSLPRSSTKQPTLSMFWRNNEKKEPQYANDLQQICVKTNEKRA